MSLIRCEGLVKIYKAAQLEVFALQGLDLQVAAGEMMALIGVSGSGKSTLLNILGGLELPSAGSCLVGDWDLLRLTSAERIRYTRDVVGFVWQNTARNLLPHLTAVENVELPMLLSGSGGLQVRPRAMELLDAVGLTDWAHRPVTILSGGQQQRVAIALALANRPQVLLADEPTGSLDSATGKQILATFREINRRYGTTMILVTHDPSLAYAVDRYVLIRDGKVAQEAVRRATEPEALTGGTLGTGLGSDETHEEWAVLDRAGRVQIPRELLEQAGLDDRAKVEVEGDRIILRRPDSEGATRRTGTK